jgi:hypothetical protein
MKKGQADVFGVAIMAVLIVALIFLTMPTAQKAANDRQETEAMVSMLKATFECNGAEKPVADFVMMCPGDCGCASVAIDYLLPTEGKRRSFEILKNGETIFERKTADCPKKSLLLPQDENIEVRLGLC